MKRIVLSLVLGGLLCTQTTRPSNLVDYLQFSWKNVAYAATAGVLLVGAYKVIKSYLNAPTGTKVYHTEFVLVIRKLLREQGYTDQVIREFFNHFISAFEAKLSNLEYYTYVQVLDDGNKSISIEKRIDYPDYFFIRIESIKK